MNGARAAPAAALAVCLAASLPFLSSLSAYFSADDFGLVQLFANKPTWHFLTLFTRPWTEAIYGVQPDELRPLIALSYQLDSLSGPSSPIGYHVSNIVVHALSCLVILTIGRRLAELSWPAAACGAVLFAVLPIQAESVSWISGRADSIPALFYLTACLAYGLWRRRGRPWCYALALFALLLALFSKQSAITLIASLVLYDVLVERRYAWLSWRVLLGYLPFVGLTVGYLWLRLVLFSNAVRENQLSPEVYGIFAARQLSFVYTVLHGNPLPLVLADVPVRTQVLRGLALAGLALAALLMAWELRPAAQARPRGWWGRLLYFGPAWWLVGVAPLAVTYEAPRHLYLAAAGPAVAAGLLFDRIWCRGRLPGRLAATVTAAALVLASLVVLRPLVEDWDAASALSEKILRDLERETAAAPPGALVLIGAPMVGASERTHTWVWMWALPFAAEPPFARSRLTDRIALIEQPDVYCCPPDQWYARTQRTLSGWLGRPERPPVIVLLWDVASGALVKQTERERPELPELAARLARSPEPRAMCRLLDEILDQQGDEC